ncbi:serine protease [Actibacterium sp. 188UL27-1]|uniref:trypsin-like serine peptidase n=1 Tax=Actibacterium sp. 188UL27-1 TaxID=2786961 RepID=UPI001957EF0A|nr:serine protease [Actibacterium sp. 188UL27-1]MBM7067442.1 trypsin-like peptidase domain-containing protein [Actibacterium sp. 188UL27-1]
MTVTSTCSALALTLTLFGSGGAAAQMALFDAADYGKAQFPARESTGDAARYIAAREGGAFESIAELAPADRLAQQARPIGRIDMLIRNRRTGEEGTSACTGALLGGGLVLTNHHCLPQEGEIEVLQASILMDYLTLDGRASQRYELDPKPLDWNADLDFAVARVPAGTPSDSFGHVTISASPEGVGTARVVIHHPLGKPKVMSRFRCMHLADRSFDPFVAHRCDTLPGSSGSLLFDDRGIAVALHRAGGLTPDDPSSFNTAVDIARILEISPILAESIAAQDAAPAAPADPADPTTPAARDTGQTGLSTNQMNDILRGE